MAFQLGNAFQTNAFAPFSTNTVPGNLSFFENTGNNFFAPNPRLIRQTRLGATRQKSGFFASSLQPQGWHIQYQDVYPPTKRSKAGGIYLRVGFLGSNLLPHGFEPLLWQPKYVRYKNLDYGDQSTQNVTTAVTPIPEFRTDTWSDLRYIWKKSPDVGDQGNQAPFIFVQTSIPEFRTDTWSDLRYIWKKSPETGDNGGIDLPFPVPAWDFNPQNFALLPKYFPKAKTVPNSGDDGTQATFTQWQNQGWPVQYCDIKHPIYKSPDTGDQGTESPFTQWYNQGWGVQYSDVRHPKYRTPEFIPDGIDSPFVNWQNQGWGVQYCDIKHSIYKSPDTGDTGIQDSFRLFLPYGWEKRYDDVKHPKFNSPDIGDGGIQAVFIAVVVPPIPEFRTDTWADLRHIWYKSPDTGDTLIDYPLVNWFNAGWEVQPVQPPHKWKKSPETGDQGDQAQFINWINQGWPIQYWDVKHPKFNSPDIGDTGIELPFIPTGFVPGIPWAFQVTPDFPFRFKKSPEKGDDGVQDLLRFFLPYGWEKSYEHIRHYFYRNLDRGDEGIQNSLFVPPIPLGQWDFPTIMVFSRTQFGGRKYAGTISGITDAGSWPPGTINPAQNIFDYIIRARRRARR